MPRSKSICGGYRAMATSVLRAQPTERTKNVGMSVTSPFKQGRWRQMLEVCGRRITMYDARPTGGQSNNEGRHDGDKGQKGKSTKQKVIAEGMAQYSALCLKSNDIRLCKSQ